ncbi:ABC transporter ATP-binding protein [Agromyces bauzanensis]
MHITPEVPPDQAPALEVTALSVRYGRAISALADVSLRVDAGEVVTLMGLNGAGKSTIVRAVTGLLPANGGSITAGAITSFGTVLTGRSPRFIVRHGVAQTMEGRRIFAGLTVQQNLDVGGATRRLADVRDRQAEVLELFPRLAERRGQLAGLLSGGEQQMLAFGRALMSSPRLLVLDEPTLGLAPKLVSAIGTAIASIRERGTSVLLIEQNAVMALSVADRGYLIEHGRIFREGSATELREDPELQQRLLGLTEDAA